METCEDCNEIIDSESFMSGCFGYSLCSECLELRGETRLHNARVKYELQGEGTL